MNLRINAFDVHPGMYLAFPGLHSEAGVTRVRRYHKADIILIDYVPALPEKDGPGNFVVLDFNDTVTWVTGAACDQEIPVARPV